jgi:hypothetical protein
METTALKDVFGTMSAFFFIELIVLIVGALSIWRKVKNELLQQHDKEVQRDAAVQEAVEGVRKYPEYREQSKKIQAELKATDKTILETCEKIQQGVDRNQQLLIERLDKLEARERNAIRDKIYEIHRIFSSSLTNPMLAWTEMERDSFNDQIADYEELGGNGYVHSVVIPDMNRLRVIPMADLATVEALMHSRKA